MKASYLVPALALPLVLAVPTVAVASGESSDAGPPTPQAALPPTVTPAAVIDRRSVRCSEGSRMVGTLERDGQRLEAEAEIFGPVRESWVVRIVQNGDLAHRISRSADSDGELDVWRYLPNRAGEDRVRLAARSADGERCVVRLSD